MVYRDGQAGTSTWAPLYYVAWGAVGPWIAQITEPENNSRIPSRNPTIKILLSASSNPAAVQYAVASDSGFTNIVWSGSDPSLSNGTHIKVVATTLTDQTNYWLRARAGDGASTWGPWSVVKVTIDTNAGRGYGEMYFNVGIDPLLLEDYASGEMYWNQGLVADPKPFEVNYMFENVGPLFIDAEPAIDYMFLGDVSTNTPTPHIWFLKPGVARDGDGVQIVCFGAGNLITQFNGVVEIFKEGAWQPVTVNSWQVYPPTVNAYTDLRILNKDTNTIDMQHQVIEITVPAGSLPPGYSLRIKTDGP